MEMARIRKPFNTTLPPDLLEELDKWRNAQTVPPSKAKVIEQAIREFLEKHGEGKQQ